MGRARHTKADHEPPGAQQRTERKIDARLLWLGIIALALVTFVAYIPALRGGFVWDDDKYVTGNPLLTSPDGLKQIWFSRNSPSQYFPLVYTALRLEHALWGFNPLGYHLINILLHIANALLLWVVLRKLSIRGAWLAAAIFALHPVNVESVAWVTELKNVLSTLFYLLTVLAWLKFIQRGKWHYHALSVVCCALALFAKTTACTIPAVLLIVLWLRKDQISLTRICQITPHALMGLVMGLVSVWWEKHLVGTVGTKFDYSPIQRLLIAGHAFWFYLGKLVLPTRLCFSYSKWSIDPRDLAPYIWVAVLGLLLGLLWSQRKRWSRDALIATVFFFVVSAPMLGFISLFTFRYSFAADHYQYLACVGPITLFAAGLMRLEQRALKCAIAALVLISLGTLTWNQGYAYRDLETLWRQTIATSPECWMAHTNLSVVLNRRGDFEEALHEAQTAVKLNPDNPEAHDSLGSALGSLGYPDQAIKEHNTAINLDPTLTNAYVNLAIELNRKGRFEEAQVACGRALIVDPECFAAHNMLGCVFTYLHKPKEAEPEFRKALSIQPDSTDGLYNLAVALISLGKTDEAISDLRKVVEAQPQAADAHGNLAKALYLHGDYAEAWNELHVAQSYGGPTPGWAADLSHKMPEPPR